MRSPIDLTKTECRFVFVAFNDTKVILEDYDDYAEPAECGCELIDCNAKYSLYTGFGFIYDHIDPLDVLIQSTTCPLYPQCTHWACHNTSMVSCFDYFNSVDAHAAEENRGSSSFIHLLIKSIGG